MLWRGECKVDIGNWWNHNSSEPQRGTSNYNPCSKYNFIFKVLVHNINYCTKYEDLDPAIDESTWGFGGYMGEASWHLMNKPFPKGQNIWLFLHIVLLWFFSWMMCCLWTGGQTAMLFDVTWCCTRAYLHCHKLTAASPPKEFRAEGPAEEVQMVGLIERLIQWDCYNQVEVMRDGAGTIHL